MKIAITSPNAKTISGHAGKCPGYLVYEIDQNQTIIKSHIKLTKDQVFKNFSGALSQNSQHPLSGIHTFITQSLGEGLNRRLQQDNIQVVTTNETHPDQLIQTLIKA